MIAVQELLAQTSGAVSSVLVRMASEILGLTSLKEPDVNVILVQTHTAAIEAPVAMIRLETRSVSARAAITAANVKSMEKFLVWQSGLQ